MRIRYLAIAIALAGCADDPTYLRPPAPGAIEAGGMVMGPTMLAIQVPIRVLDPDDENRHTKTVTELMVDPGAVPYVRRDDMDVEIEWTVKNLDPAQGTAIVTVNGANEYFHYNPDAFVIDPEEDEPAPPLMGGIPMVVEPNATLSGVFREDQVSEMAQDLDAISRWGITPEAAILDRWPNGDITGSDGMVHPSVTVPAILSFEVNFTASTHMVLEYVVRVRDHNDRLVGDYDMATFTGTLRMPSMTDFVPPPPPMP